MEESVEHRLKPGKSFTSLILSSPTTEFQKEEVLSLYAVSLKTVSSNFLQKTFAEVCIYFLPHNSLYFSLTITIVIRHLLTFPLSARSFYSQLKQNHIQ